MQCPLCRQECEEKKMHTFLDYAETADKGTGKETEWST